MFKDGSAGSSLRADDQLSRHQLSRRVHSLRARELRCRDGHTPCSVDNQNIYDGVGCKITENVFQGRNGTLFAYGQTSAGARPLAHRPAVASTKINSCRVNTPVNPTFAAVLGRPTLHLS